MREIETTAKTRQEAIQKALDELGVELHEVEIEIVDEGSKGVLGFGKRDVHVRVKAESLPDEPETRRERRPKRRRGGGGKPERKEAAPQTGDTASSDRTEDTSGEGGSSQRSKRRRRTRGRRRGNRRPSTQKTTAESSPSASKESRGGNGNRSGGQRGASKREDDRSERKPSRRSESRPSRPPRAKRERSEPMDREKAEKMAETGSSILKEIIDKMGMECTVSGSVTDEGDILIHVDSEDSAILIGRKGSTLHALQFIMNRILLQGEEYGAVDRVIVDVERYRERRRESLEEMARDLAEKAKETGRSMRVKPLSPQERRIVHLALEGDDEVRTYSLGNSMLRRIVIVPEGADDSNGRDDQGVDDEADEYETAEYESDDE